MKHVSEQILQLSLIALLVRLVVFGGDLGTAIAFVGSCVAVIALEIIRIRYTPKVATHSQAELETKVAELEHRLSSLALSVAFKPHSNPLKQKV